VTALGAGAFSSFAILSDGTVRSWGYNSSGQLGDGTRTEQPTPVQVPNLGGVVAVSGGFYHTLALKSDGTVWGWGGNESARSAAGSPGAPIWCRRARLGCPA
jgi:alpha-tubulin suppressor-like RCC1 family protein